MLAPEAIADAAQRITPYLHRTPLEESTLLNDWLGHRVVFKADGLQRTGAFKARGALNILLKLKEENRLPERIAAYSSGNHAMGVAWAASIVGVPATIFMQRDVSDIKKRGTRAYGAWLVETENRKLAEAMCRAAGEDGAFILPPYDHDDVIAGQGTAALEALQDAGSFDAVFTPIGGGGLLSGTWLATRLLAPNAEVYAGEPSNANDAARSYRAGKIEGFDTSPASIADGARTLRLAQRTFEIVQQTGGVFEIPEDDIIYWAQWLTHLLKLVVEPTAALGMAAAFQWLCLQKQRKEVLVILSGANMDRKTQQALWSLPSLDLTPSQRIRREKACLPSGGTYS